MSLVVLEWRQDRKEHHRDARNWRLVQREATVRIITQVLLSKWKKKRCVCKLTCRTIFIAQNWASTKCLKEKKVTQTVCSIYTVSSLYDTPFSCKHSWLSRWECKLAGPSLEERIMWDFPCRALLLKSTFLQFFLSYNDSYKYTFEMKVNIYIFFFIFYISRLSIYFLFLW